MNALLVLLAIAISPVGRSELCVTEGVVGATPDGKLSVDTPASRAVLRFASEPYAEIRFRYLGGTAGSKALASGTMRRQVGLKLRAHDGCNVVYVMWRIKPKSEIVVSVKRNPDMHTSAECGNAGYTNIKPRNKAPVRRIAPGETHSLRAELQGTDLYVFDDNLRVWEGDVGREVREFDGPVGFRTDNAHIVFEYFTRGVHGERAECKSSPSPGE